MPLKINELYKTPVFEISNQFDVHEAYGAQYDRKTRVWRMPAFYPVADIVVSDLKNLIPNLKIPLEIQEHLNTLKQACLLPSEFNFITKPFEHQKEGLLHLFRYLRAGLFYSPGLGKTKIVIDLQRLINGRLLILCPKIMLTEWAAEFVKHGNDENTLVIAGTKKKKLTLIEQACTDPVTAVMVTYETATRYVPELMKIPYDVIVADESHKLKSPFSQRTKAAQALARKAYRRILLSGTPSLGSPFDLYGQLRFLGTYFCPEPWWPFKRKFGEFAPWDTSDPPKIIIGYKNLPVMNKRVNLVCTRKTQDECLDLPERRILDVIFDISPAQKKLYNFLIEEKCDPAGIPIYEKLCENSLTHADGVHLHAHVIADPPIVLLNKVDQVSSGFLYQTSKNLGVCNDCKHLTTCVSNDIAPYTSKCAVVTKEKTSTLNITPNARLEACQGILENLVEDSTNSVIIWARYDAELAQLERLLKQLKLNFVLVRGKLSHEALKERRDKFDNDPECQVYVGQVSTGVGITINKANYTIYYNLPWHLEHYLQSLDRNYRIGQERKVTVYRLIAQNTIDEIKAVALDQKIDFDTLVTSNLPCVQCDDFVTRCAKAQVELYSDYCKYDRSMQKTTAKIRKIP